MNLYQHKVQYYETDQMGIVHHSNYIRWMEEARIDFLNQIGCDYKSMEENGIISPVTGVECKYKITTKFYDVITIKVSIVEFKGIKLKLKYEMRRGEDLVCDASSEHCFLDREGKIINVKRSHPALYETLSSYVQE